MKPFVSFEDLIAPASDYRIVIYRCGSRRRRKTLVAGLFEGDDLTCYGEPAATVVEAIDRLRAAYVGRRNGTRS